MPSVSPSFLLRVFSVDYYFDAPRQLDASFSALHGALHRVPVLRVFGATPGGQRVCLHVHRIVPYFFVRYDESLPQARAQNCVPFPPRPCHAHADGWLCHVPRVWTRRSSSCRPSQVALSRR